MPNLKLIQLLAILLLIIAAIAIVVLLVKKGFILAGVFVLSALVLFLLRVFGLL